ncbi:SRPBCC family protein [Ferrimonas pelagia]|uniref:Polyketide cyclase / dehydrase and lipid transport n=1 Tax=Ferrimonas pelagia TaxID=1177826 RepID=A0ABP9FEQ0_9GAMM
MKYQCQVLIALPRKRVIALFDDPDNLPRWQPELLSFEPLEGILGQPGSTSRLLYRMGKKEVVMLETVIERALPDRFCARYQADGVDNRCDNRFFEQDNGTLWQMETEFRFHGWMRLMCCVPWLFKRQTLASMQSFKTFAEQQGR